MNGSIARVGDVLELQRRHVDVEPTSEYTLIGIYSWGKGIFHRDPAPGADLGDYRFSSIQSGDLVLSNIQAWEGAIGFATDRDDGTVGTHRFLTYRARDDRIDPNWARWFFLSDAGMEMIRSAAPGTTMRNRTLAIERFENLEIPIPPIEEQLRVAGRFDRADEGVRQLHGLMEQSELLADALRVSLVSPFNLSSAERGAQGWRKVAIDDLVTEQSSATPVDPIAEYRIAGVYSFGRGLIDRGAVVGSETSYRSFTTLRSSDVVFSKLGAWEGAVSVVPPEFADFSVSSEFPVFRLDTDVILPPYLMGVARAPWFWAAMNAETRGSMARRKRITPSQFLATSIPLPSIEQQHQVVGVLGALDEVAPRHSGARDHRDALVAAIKNEEFSRFSER